MISYEPASKVWRRRWRRWRGVPVRFATSWIDGRRHASDFANVDTYCMFIGYPRSGHSLVGSLISAHPEAVIADELDALRYVQLGFKRSQIYSLILRSDAEFNARGRQANMHNYEVPGTSQGSFDRLRVIGDKKGGASTIHLDQHPDLLGRLERTVADPVRFVHVTRNPFDNAAALFNMSTWGGTFEAAVDAYLNFCHANDQLRRRVAGRVFDMRHEDLIADGRSQLAAVCGFLNLSTTPEYLDACASILYESPNKTRHNAPWTPELRRRVEEATSEYAFLRDYGWDD